MVFRGKKTFVVLKLTIQDVVHIPLFSPYNYYMKDNSHYRTLDFNIHN